MLSGKMYGIIIGILIVGLFSLAILHGNPSITGHITSGINKNCSIACYSSKDCNDHNNSTLDVCRYPGECNSTCKNIMVTIVPSLG